MINDDILIKYTRARGFKHLSWPEQVVKMKARMTEMKLGFPGLGNDHLSLIEFKDVKLGDLIIIDPYIEFRTDDLDTAPIMLKILGDHSRVEGIGKGQDKNDPFRNKVRWKDNIETPNLDPGFLVYRVEVRPDLNGGPGYYYFFKSYRDFRD